MFKPIVSGLRQAFRKTMTFKYPTEKLGLPPRFRARHYLYQDRCTGCGICAWICPEKCISIVQFGDEGKKFPQFYYGRCCFCHFCVDYCPKDALAPTDDYELAAYDQESLVFSPDRLAQPPKEVRHAVYLRITDKNVYHEEKE